MKPGSLARLSIKKKIKMFIMKASPLNGQSRQILDYILWSRKLNQFFL
jgi:hypothetical protein